MVQRGFLGQDFGAALDVPTIDLRSEFLAGGSRFDRYPGEWLDGADVSDVIYTSGTTGRPKGAMMNHRQTLRMYEEWATLADLREGDRYLMINPYFHTFGLKARLVASFLRGATMLPVAVFDIYQAVELIDRERITMLPGPPTLYHSLLTVADKGRLSTLLSGVTGAADIPVELVRRIHDELPFQTLMTGYGLTESGNVTLSRPGDSFSEVATTAGIPCDDVEVQLADDGRCWCVVTASCRVTSTTRSRPPRRSMPTGGCTPEISASSPTRAGCASGEAADADELIEWSRERMAGYEAPRYVEFVDDLPTNATGTVVKDRLRSGCVQLGNSISPVSKAIWAGQRMGYRRGDTQN